MEIKQVSIVIPLFGRETGKEMFIKRLARVFENESFTGELILVDDQSNEKTQADVMKLSHTYEDIFAIVYHSKQGQSGREQSFAEGLALAKYDTLVMMDIDPQYSPETLPSMFVKLAQGADVVVANHSKQHTNIFCSLISVTEKFFFSRLLHRFHFDSQSGLKVFRKQILQDIVPRVAPGSFDLAFLLAARNFGYHIDSVVATHFGDRTLHSPRQYQVGFWRIIWRALWLKWQGHAPLIIQPDNKQHSMIGAGVAHNRQRFVTHTTLHHRISALRTFAPWQRNSIFMILGLTCFGFLFAPLNTGIIIIAVLSAVYFIDTVFNFGLVLRSLQLPPEMASTRHELRILDEEDLPIYSVLCPLYKEAHMLPGFVAAIDALDWPKDKLDVLLLLEENDPETIAAARAMMLPVFIRIVVVPHSMPKTKPKACNYGLSLARGSYVVIYDAEDVPDPFQLKKAYLGFRKAGPEVKCLQAKLNYFNPHENLLTRFFTAEYSLWFDIILVGLQSISTSIPLGGTSNHFRTSDLLELEGWDPFNVTEDCDLGVRIFKRGYRTAIIDSVTLEEANGRPLSWLKQRSRWIKGYMQTYLVHMRHPFQFIRENGIHALVFQLVVGGKIAFLFINPILWLTTIAYFTLYAFVGPTIQLLYPTWVFYMAALSLVFGNFLYIYYYMIGCAKRQHWSLIKYVLFIPIYWVMGSVAAYIALYELIVRPHYWQKTNHGVYLIRKEAVTSNIGILAGFSWFQKVLGSTGGAPTQLRDLIFSSKGILIAGLILSNFLNFLFNAYLGRVLSYEFFALVTLMNTLWFFVMIVMGAFSSTLNHSISFLLALNKSQVAHRFFRTSLRQALIFSSFISLFWLSFVPYLTEFFRLEHLIPLIFFTPVFIFGVLLAGNRGYLQGSLSFVVLAGVFLIESLIKFFLATLFITLDRPELAYLSIPLSIVGAAMFVLGITSRSLPEALMGDEPGKAQTFPIPFFSAALLTSLSAIVFLSVDILLVSHYFSPLIAGQYALLSLVGKMIYFLGSLPNFFMMTYVSRNEGLKKKSTKVLTVLYEATLIIVLGGVIVLGVFGQYTVPFLLGSKALIIVPLLLPYTGAVAFFTLSGVIISYHLAKRRYIFSGLGFLIALSMIGGIIMSHDSLYSVVWVVVSVSIIGWVLLLVMHFTYDHLSFFWRALRDFVGVFYNGLPKNSPDLAVGKKRILIFNWRDTKHKFAGGAEVYVHEIAKGWVKEGNQVTLFCGNDGKQKRYEEIDGIRIIRRGGFYLVYVWAFLYYSIRLRGKYDIIIDCENGIPFFTPLYVRKPIFCLLHHVHQEIFYYSLPWPLAWFASFLEKDLMAFFYKAVKFITVSESSKNDMVALGIGQAGIQVVHPGVHLSEYSSLLAEKTLRPTILYLGRLKAYKSVNILIQAFRLVLSERPEVTLIIAGDGEEKSSLMRLARELRLTSEQVQFIGHVSHEEKIKLLQSSWVLVNPSFREGWGIVNIEANASGTPVIASDVPGLRDSVQNADTGYLVEYGDTRAFAECILTVIRDVKLRESLVLGGHHWADRFDWQLSSTKFFFAISGHESE